MALSSAVVTANRSFWTGAKEAFPAPEAAPDPELPEPDEQPTINAANAANAVNAVNAKHLGAFQSVLARSRSLPLGLARSDWFILVKLAQRFL